MDFGEYAAKETSDLAARLAKASADAVEQAAKRVTEEAQKSADALRAELQATVKQKMSVAASLKETQAQAETLRGELKTAAERTEVVSRQLADARKANEKLEAARTELSGARDELATARAAAEAEARRMKEALDGVRAELTLAGKKLEKALAEKASVEETASAAHSQSQASEAKLGAVTDLFKQSGARVKALERTLQEYERTIKDLEARPQSVPQPDAAATVSPVPVLDDLLAGFQALGAATTIADVLTTLVEQLAAQFPRVALFRVRKNHLQGEHQIGFDLKTDIAKVVMPLGMDSLLSRAASSGQIEQLSGAELKESRAPFAGTPSSALALPVMVNGEPLAIVYADDAGTSGAEGEHATELNARFAEAMQQHAAALLARLSNELKTLAELQAYAASLLRELETMHAADVQAGVAGKELQERLKGNLEYARSIYSSRIALEGADAAALLDDEVAALIEAQQGSPFGGDLAVAAGRPDLARNAAEAS